MSVSKERRCRNPSFRNLWEFLRVRTFRDGQGRAPLITENVETDAAVAVDVRVVDASCEVDFRRLEWIIWTKSQHWLLTNRVSSRIPVGK
jgi:hypothetical protein